jgi:Fe2+ transport system protein FeoA
MVLWSLRRGEEAIVSDLSPELCPEHRRRFIELGFREGERVHCLQTTPFGGPKVFGVVDTVYSVDFEDARHVRVRPVSPF